jgi:hypothetical protein
MREFKQQNWVKTNPWWFIKNRLVVYKMQDACWHAQPLVPNEQNFLLQLYVSVIIKSFGVQVSFGQRLSHAHHQREILSSRVKRPGAI